MRDDAVPNYDFYCEECDFEWEDFEKMEDLPDVKCPECGGPGKVAFKAKPNVILDLEEHFDYGIGKRIRSRRQKRETLKRINGEREHPLEPMG
jgi:putative FmdB family regulatory protein